MAKFVKGDVVVIPFPFSDLSQSKRRPALVLAALQGDDLILCQITSKSIKDNYAIPVDENDFESGSLNQESNIRPNRLFTADNHIILYRIGNIKIIKLNQVIDKVVEIIKE
ncbi:MAG TPA: type II toxin-antitoxin system PemK/MazF family toxin [Smithellaceae bacterium]|nr:type II toxin-antitoxin system PemK/MazF family toxin [Smithellaceae bacterium]HOE33553.1 type II toxin-antitoxin system PemK/MazF family toxin [Smithella sp.]HOG82699.1 type II toxin-antitoxin system PemK/MazF family toxin [Smithellaceae bacterium]HPV49744.1 type II toxin-antitoxin system PemK/MazF family toxin [Smithellaceae bacterium]